jgi:vacuolar-type H+-ATPase subunit I/STV1
VALIGVSWMRDFPTAGAIVPALFLPLWQPLRQRFVEPRLGFVEFSDSRERQNRERLKLLVYLGIVALVAALVLSFNREIFPADPNARLVAALPATILAVLAAATALLIASTRFLVYAGVLLAAGSLGALLGWSPGAIMAVAGTVMLVSAIAIFTKFLVANPIDSGDAA